VEAKPTDRGRDDHTGCAHLLGGLRLVLGAFKVTAYLALAPLADRCVELGALCGAFLDTPR
jgi:hypothetical protein